MVKSNLEFFFEIPPCACHFLLNYIHWITRKIQIQHMLCTQIVFTKIYLYRLIFSGNFTLICYLPGQVGEQIPHFLSIYFPYLSTFVEHQLPPASSSLTQLLCFTPAQIKGKTHGWSGCGLSLSVFPLWIVVDASCVRQFALVPANFLFHCISTSQLVAPARWLACLMDFIQNLWF